MLLCYVQMAPCCVGHSWHTGATILTKPFKLPATRLLVTAISRLHEAPVADVCIVGPASELWISIQMNSTVRNPANTSGHHFKCSPPSLIDEWRMKDHTTRTVPAPHFILTSLWERLIHTATLIVLLYSHASGRRGVKAVEKIKFPPSLSKPYPLR